MAEAALDNLVQQLRRLTALPGTDALTDRQLLDRFVRHHEESAFAALVQRHGQLVLGVCRRVLQQEQDAEDAFQATFLVLARKAASVRWQESVSHWLYEVASRLARKAKVSRSQRQVRESQLPARPDAVNADLSWREMQGVLDEELQRLPEKYRAPLVLCYLEGLTQDEAARRLGWTLGTVRGRLWRGRDLLKGRLERRGLALSAVLGAMLLVPARVSAALVNATVRAGAHFAAGSLATGAVPAGVRTLTEGMLKTMFMTKLKVAAVLLLAAGVFGTGTDFLGRHVLGRQPAPTAEGAAEKLGQAADRAPEEDAQRDAPQKTDDPARRTDDRRPQGSDDPRRADDNRRRDDGRRTEKSPRPDLSGKIARVSADGTKITVEIVSRTGRDSQLEAREIVLTDKTQQTYFQVGPDGAKPTVGYTAAVYLTQGSPDTAAQVLFTGVQPMQRSVTGRLGAVSADGKTLTLDVPNLRRGEPREIGHLDINVTDKTQMIYSGVGKGGARPTVGYLVRVELAAGSDNTAAKVYLSTPERAARP